MPHKLLTFVRHNAIALLALFVALGGTSYAALNLPANSVGSKQIRNRSITPVKLDPNSIAATIRARVDLQFRGNNLAAVSTSSPVQVVTTDDGESIKWLHVRFSSSCLVAATAHINFNTQRPVGFGDGYVNAQFIAPNQVFLRGYGPNGAPRPQAASVEMVCP